MVIMYFRQEGRGVNEKSPTTAEDIGQLSRLWK
jgi:hypothetical protein